MPNKFFGLSCIDLLIGLLILIREYLHDLLSIYASAFGKLFDCLDLGFGRVNFTFLTLGIRSFRPSC